ncbi:MAG: PilZ domain-containing protein [Nitrospirae bacterium]|nr:PilZ domain-containing protein [Nitrospirota bacterium]
MKEPQHLVLTRPIYPDRLYHCQGQAMEEKKYIEKRKYSRYAVEGVTGNLLFATNVRIINISTSGVAIESTRRVDINREYILRFEYKGNKVSLKCAVMWSFLYGMEKNEKGETIPIYRAGMQISEEQNEKINTLMKFIEEHRLERLERRLSGIRFKIVADKIAELSCPQNYRIKKLSIGGMLIESDTGLEKETRYPMEIHLDGEIIRVIGRVVHCTQVTLEHHIRYDIGIEFIEITEKDRNILNNFLKNL